MTEPSKRAVFKLLSFAVVAAVLSSCQNPLGGSGSTDPLYAPGVPAMQGIQIVGSSQVPSGSCSGPYQIEVYDTTGNVIAVPMNLSMNLSGAGTGTFYQDSSCTVPFHSSLTFPTNASEVDFYYEASSPQTTTFDISSSYPGLVSGSLSVTAGDGLNAFTVTPSGMNVTISPSSAQTVNSGETQAFTVTPSTGYTTSATVGGTCAAGSWSGSTYTTGSVTANCTVTFSATINTYTVTPSGTNVTLSPSTAQTVNYNGTQAIAVTPNTGYTTSATVGGTCAAGSWSGNTYTTGSITADCTVTFSAAINTYTVTPSGDGNETISPSTAQTVNYNGTQAFTVTANTNYTTSATVGGTCAAGSWSGSTYTTGSVTANCTVTFSATTTPFSANWNFASPSPYTTSASTIDFNNGYAELTPSSQTDNSDVTAGFAGGNLTGTTWSTASDNYSNSDYVMLSHSGTPTNNSELSSDWAPAWSNLVDYWRFDNSWTDSISGLAPTLSNNATFSTFAKMGSNSASFGGNGYLIFNSYNNVPTTQVTVTAWVYFNSATAWGTFLKNWADANSGVFHFGLDNTSGKMSTYITESDGTIIGPVIDSNTFPLSSWQFVAFTADGSNVNLYRNAQSVGTPLAYNGTLLSSFTCLGIAAKPNNTCTGLSSSPQYLDGYIDEVGIWNTALTPTQIQTIYSRQSATYGGTFTSRVMDGLATGSSWTSARLDSDFAFLQGAPRFWNERELIQLLFFKHQSNEWHRGALAFG